MHSMPADRFEGIYGRLYNRVIQTPALRRAVFTLWGSADPILDLDRIVAAAAAEVGSGTLLDVPCGGGTTLALLARARFGGTVIESDLADAMMRRAASANAHLRPPFAVQFLQADARELPLDRSAVDGAISINGLHVIPGPERFIAELARVIRPGGSLTLITPVSSDAIRGRVILRAARALGITPAPPPTAERLHAMLEAAGFRIRSPLGGTSITGVICDLLDTEASS
jgi:ubiquinone/menaquinone biosynthesis C-methylase UbiE